MRTEFPDLPKQETDVLLIQPSHLVQLFKTKPLTYIFKDANRINSMDYRNIKKSRDVEFLKYWEVISNLAL